MLWWTWPLLRHCSLGNFILKFKNLNSMRYFLKNLKSEKKLFAYISLTFIVNWQTDTIEKNRCFQSWKWNAFSLILPYFLGVIFQRWKWNAFSLILPYFSSIFFTNSENGTKSKFRQEMLNILSALNLRDCVWHFMNEKSVSAWFHR